MASVRKWTIPSDSHLSVKLVPTKKDVSDNSWYEGQYLNWELPNCKVAILSTWLQPMYTFTYA
jgi:hypothetical protein